MNDRDRNAWAKALGSALLPSPTGESGLIVVPGRLPSKANLHEVHFHPAFWQQIRFLAALWRKQQRTSPFWVAPSDATRLYQATVAAQIRGAEPFRFDGPLVLEITLHGQTLDVDNTKVLADAIEASGVIKNDAQFQRLTVEKHPAAEPRVELKI